MTLLLPAEVLERIFRMLPPKDLKRAVEVCRRWREVSEVPGFWVWVRLWVRPQNFKIMKEVLERRRFKPVEKLTISMGLDRSRGKMSEKLLQAVIKHPGLKELDLQDAELHQVEPKLLMKVLGKMETIKIHLEQCRLTKRQIETFFFFNGHSDKCQLKKLHLKRHQYSLFNIKASAFAFLDPELLARTTSKLEELEIFARCLSTEQILAVLVGLGEASSKIRKLRLEQVNLFVVIPAILVSVVEKLEEVNLVNTSVTNEQVEAVLAAILTDESKLRLMNLSRNNLSLLDTTLLARSFAKLEVVQLEKTSLTSEQLETVLTAVPENSNLKTLNLSENNLSLVNVTLLLKAISQLKELSLANARLTTHQAEAVLTAIAEDSNLTMLDISGNSLSVVDPATLARLVEYLEVMNICDTSLSELQEAAILTAITTNSKLRILKMNEPLNANPELMTMVTRKLEEVSLSYHLDHEDYGDGCYDETIDQ